MALNRDLARGLVLDNDFDSAVLLPSALGVIGSNGRARSEALGGNVSSIYAVAFQGVGDGARAPFRQALVVRFLSGAFPTGVALDRDASIGRIAPDDIGDLVDSISAVARQVGAVKFKVHIG